MSSSEDNCEETIAVYVPGAPSRRLNVQVPASDIDACVGFSLLRCVLSTISLLLALTDVPRTGLGLSSLKGYFEVVGLDTVMYFGPYAYPVAHFYKSPAVNSSSGYEATCGGERIESVDVWAYKFDSLSIPTRALAQHLNVTAYPRCVLYKEPCTQDILSLGSAFVMLDELITAFKTKYITPAAAESLGFTQVPLKFATESHWVDRLHHFLVKPFRDQTELRTHFVQYFGPISHQLHSNICDPVALDGTHNPSVQPLVCDLEVVWKCDHPELGAATQIPIWDHVAQRIAALRRQYPGLDLDLTMISSRMVLRGHKWVVIPSVSFSTDTLEISTLIRGRNCSMPSASGAAQCETVFVDDYRYERATFVSDTEQWWFFAAALRGMGQIFVWVRFALLWLGCYSARTAEKKLRLASWCTKLYVTWLTVAKIPNHMLIYGSWFPICCYVFAHYIDCALIHLISNTAWSTINGVVHFEPIKYGKIASIQMRNLWLVALVVRLLMVAYQSCSGPRQRPWTRNHGIVGVRAILFGTISSLTVFSCLRVRGFRDSSIVRVEILSEQIPLRGCLAFGLDNNTEFGFRFDLKTLTIAASIVLILIPIMRVAIAFVTGDRCIALTCHSYYVPHSAESLWNSGSLLVYWCMRLSDNHHHLSRLRHAHSDRFSVLFSNRVLPVVVLAAPAHQQHQKRAESCCRVCPKQHQQQLTSRWQVVQGCPSHDSLVDVASRSKRHWSAVRLMNLAMLTDPLVLARIYLVGQQVFIYSIKPIDLTTEAEADPEPRDRETQTRQLHGLKRQPGSTGTDRLYVVPYRLPEWGSDDDESACSGGYELVGSTNVSLLPWTVLMNCG